MTAGTPDASWFPDTAIGEVEGVPVPQRFIFDPAVAQYSHGFRLGTETIEDPDDRAHWLAAKRAVGTAVLDRIARSSLGPTLVLRGSWLLSLWFGGLAREPHDLDFVALRPAGAGATMADLRALLADPGLAATGVRAEAITSADIWTYERVEGRRLGVPWRRPDGTVGALQIDVTFDEDLDEPPIETSLATGAPLATASLGQSLIWKLQWLFSDEYPQGKDLFDAVLLHRRDPLTAARWQAAVARIGTERRRPGPDDLVLPMTEWDWFEKEYPHLTPAGSLNELRDELLDAVRAVSVVR